MKNLVFSIVVFWGFDASSQNLITNPSFEEIDSCYGTVAGIGFDVFTWSGCNTWTCPTKASSDLWCQNPVVGNVTPPQMFNLGYQFPRNGENMAGLYLFDLNDQNYREYAEVELEQELENKYYSFSIYVSPGEQGLGYENYSNCLQAHFSENKVTASYYYVLNVEPQWKNLEMITDTSGWVKLEGTFKANGGERFITIGCFDDSASIVVDNHDPFTTSDIYYFLDDANLSEAAFSIHFPNVFSPNGDGINDIFLPEIVHVPDYEVYIYNRWGNLMTILSESTPGWDGAEAQEGTYFYVLEKESLNIKEQGFFQLVRS